MIQWRRRGFVRFFLPSRRKNESNGRLHQGLFEGWVMARIAEGFPMVELRRWFEPRRERMEEGAGERSRDRHHHDDSG